MPKFSCFVFLWLWSITFKFIHQEALNVYKYRLYVQKKDINDLSVVCDYWCKNMILKSFSVFVSES